MSVRNHKLPVDQSDVLVMENNWRREQVILSSPRPELTFPERNAIISFESHLSCESMCSSLTKQSYTLKESLMK